MPAFSFPSFAHVAFSLLLFHVTKSEEPKPILSCNFNDGTFCNWQAEPNFWHVGNKIPLSGSYAYIEGGLGTRTEGRLFSPLLSNLDGGGKVEFEFWKSTVTPSIELCLLNDNDLVCLDTASTQVLHKWTKHSTALPSTKQPLKIIFRIRNLKSSLDIVGIDNVVLLKDSSKLDSSTEQIFIETTTLLQYQAKIRESSQVSETADYWKKTGSPLKQETPVSLKRFWSIQQSSQFCKAIRCTTSDSVCPWNLSKHWRRSEGRLLISSEGAHTASSELFIAPLDDSFFEFNLWMSDNAQLAVLEDTNNNETELWSRTGHLYGKGWHPVRIPARSHGLPSTLRFKANVPLKNFLAISDIKLTNVYGQEVSCDSTHSAIATTIKSTLEKAAIIVAPVAGTTTAPGVDKNMLNLLREENIHSIRTNLRIQNYYTRNQSPIRPQIIRGASSYKTKSQSGREGNRLTADTQFTEPNHMTSNMLRTQLSDRTLKTVKSLRSPVIFSRLNSEVPITQRVQPAVVPSLEPIHSPSTDTIISHIASQPMLLDQIRNMARQMGFPNLSGQQALELLKALLSLKTREKLMGKNRAEAKGVPDLSNQGLQPIKPVNAPPGTELKLKDDLGVLSSLFPGGLRSLSFLNNEAMLTQNLNGEFLKKFATIFTPPSTQVDSQQPLTRQNLDFVIQNANSV